MSLKLVHFRSLLVLIIWIAMLCTLLNLSWTASAQETIQSVDGVIARQDGDYIIRQMEWDPAEAVLLVGSGEGAYLLNPDFNLVQRVTQGERAWSVSWNPTGTEFVVTTRTGYQIWAWDGQLATLAREIAVTREIVAAYWSSFGSKIATVERLVGELFSITVQVVIRSAVTGEVLQTSADYFSIPTENAIADQWDWSPTDDRYLYGVGYTVEIRADGLPYISRDRMVYRLDTESGTVEQVTTLGESVFYSIGLDPTGSYLIATGEGAGIQIWSFAENRRVAQFPGPTSGVSWRHDGQFVMAGPSVIDIGHLTDLGWFNFGATLVRVNWRYNRVASAWDTSLLLQDLTAFEAYTPIMPITETPFPTPILTLTFTPTSTNTPSPTPTFTSTHTPTSTETPIPTVTFTPTPTPTEMFTSTPTFTPTFTHTATSTSTPTPTATLTSSFTPQPPQRLGPDHSVTSCGL